jgi:tRNA/rRNA methyltransferase
VYPELEFVLVRPRQAANVAAACRALKNMGFGRLTVVDAPEGLDQPEVRGLAYGAWDVLDSLREAPDLRTAVSGATVVVGTTGKGEGRECLTPRELAAQVPILTAGGACAVVFGPEHHGLTTEELRLCHRRVHIPTDAAQPSLNLAQAVLVLAYELRLASREDTPSREEVEERLATGELEELLGSLREALLAIGYLNPQQPDAVMGELRQVLWRARPNARELSLLRGLVRQIAWAGRRA